MICFSNCSDASAAPALLDADGLTDAAPAEGEADAELLAPGDADAVVDEPEPVP